MQIIILVGNGHTGKSMTLNNVYISLKAKGAKVLEEIRPIGAPANNDFDCLLKYKKNIIRIFSQGDYYRVCKSLLEETQKDKFAIDILIIAYNTKFKSKLDEYVMRIDSKNKIIEKNEASDLDNERTCKEILNTLESYL